MAPILPSWGSPILPARARGEPVMLIQNAKPDLSAHLSSRLKQVATSLDPATSPDQIDGQVAQNDTTLPERVRPWDVLALLDQCAHHISTLSLDCFDTLLWRKTRTPIDVFYDLQDSPEYRKHHLSAKARVMAEGQARNLKLVECNKSEVDLRAIYQRALPRAGQDEIAALCRAELNAEIATCFAFPHIVELIDSAKKRGLRVIIVSDTYFCEEDLRTLLERCLPGDTYRAIDAVFCSNATGRSKAGGLFGDVLESLRERPHKILHIGDNYLADYVGARKKQVLGVHLEQFEEHVSDFLRLCADGSAIACPETRRTRGLESLYHGVFSHREQPKDGARILGYLGCGPILFAFAQFISQQIAEHEKHSPRVKPVFLMRDGYLPYRVFSELFPDSGAKTISISRYVSYAASFQGRSEIMDYLARSARSGRWETMLRQLLVPEKLRPSILMSVAKASRKEQEFVKQVTKERVVSEIVRASAAFRERLYRYLEQQVDLSSGDTLLFIDLGYEGTAQRCLGPVFRTERDIDIHGCYLMAASVPGWQKTRAGLLDPSWCDDRTLATLIPYVAVLEDMCTARIPSVVDYDDEGQPVLGDQLVPEEQFRRVLPVQDQCIEFARDASAFFMQSGGLPTLSQMRFAAAGFITRLLFFPSKTELDYLDGFTLDLGLGTEDAFPLFDRELGLMGLRQRGLFFMEDNKKSLRMNYPYELYSSGLELSMTLLAQRRFGLEIGANDLTQRSQQVPVLAVKGGQETIVQSEARATHDGCFALTIPVGACEFDLGLLFGKVLTCVQLVSCDLIRAEELMGSAESLFTQDLMVELRLEGIQHPGENVLFLDDQSFLFVSPGRFRDGDRRFAIRCVYRPLASRK